MRVLAISFIAVMLGLPPRPVLGGEGAVDVEGLAEATEAFLEELSGYEEVSLALMIARDGVPVLARAYGLANRSFGVPNRVDTRFNLASMNKMFTAVAVMHLVQQGRLHLDDSVGDHIPDYPNEAVRTGVTVYQLLTHTAGMGNIFGTRYSQTPVNRYRSVSDYLPLFVSDDLAFTPGSRYEYSNAGYILLGYLVENVTRQDYYTYVKDNVFSPAGMKDTDCYDVQYPIPNLAIGYSRSASRSEEHEYKTIEYMKMTKGGPAGGGYSTVGDLIKFGDALFNDVLLDSVHTELMTTGKVDVDDLPQGGRYCFGLVEQVINGHRIVGHSGNLSGIRSTLKVYVDDDISIAILSNFDRDQGAEELEYFIQDLITGGTEFTRTYLNTCEMIRTVVLDGYEYAAGKYTGTMGGTQVYEYYINSRAYRLLGKGENDRAIDLFRFNAFAFPNSSNAHDSLAEAYMLTGYNEKAIHHYRRALEIDPESESAIEALKNLGAAE
jgi:CubicO group peptidase (beta-lactamase class C family)